jgi:glycerophosphoryl diester phosphodiesterase
VKSLPVKYKGIEQVLADRVRDAGMVEDVAVISFDHRVVRETLELEPGLVGGVLVAGRPLLLPELLDYSHAAVYSPHWSFVDDETVAEVHASGAVLGVWTVDDAETLDICLGLGVDAIYTNRPRQLKEELTRRDGSN